MKTRLIILPLLLGNLLLTSCAQEKGSSFKDPYEYQPEWMNHPYEVLRYPDKGVHKVKVSGHKKYSFDENLTVRNAVLSIPYESFVRQDTEIVKTKNYVTYTVNYGYGLNDVLAEVNFFDNGKIHIKDCYNYEYNYSLDVTSMRIIFAAAEQDILDVEAKNLNAKTLADEACKPENFANNCIKVNESTDQETLKYTFGSVNEKTNKVSYYSYYATADEKSDVANAIKALKYKGRRTESVSTLKFNQTVFSYVHTQGTYYSVIDYSSGKYKFHFVKRYSDYSTGKTAYFHTSYEISKETYANFFTVLSKAANAARP